MIVLITEPTQCMSCPSSRQRQKNALGISRDFNRTNLNIKRIHAVYSDHQSPLHSHKVLN
jgi:hypothetical protein